MKAKGNFMFKDCNFRESGTFTDKETGEEIKFDSCYVLVADDLEDSNKERRFKFTDKLLADDLKLLDPYTKVEVEFKVDVYTSNCKLTPVAVNIL